MSALTEKERLSALVAEFGEEMRRRLWFKETVGRKGWDDPDSIMRLRASLKEHVDKYGKDKNPWRLVNVANIACLLWYLELKPLLKRRRKNGDGQAPEAG